MKVMTHQHMFQVPTVLWLALIALPLLVFSGCVSSGTYESMVQERDQVLAEKAQLQEEKDQIAAERQALEEEKTALSAQIEEIAQQKEMAAGSGSGPV